MALHEIEAGIKTLAIKARDGKLSIDEMTGGTFTITNGGVLWFNAEHPNHQPTAKCDFGNATTS